MEGWVTGGRVDNSGFIVWQCCIAESILAVTLLEHSALTDGLGR